MAVKGLIDFLMVIENLHLKSDTGYVDYHGAVYFSKKNNVKCSIDAFKDVAVR